MRPFTHPKVEIMIATAIAMTPTRPSTTSMTAVATRSRAA